LCFWEVSIEFHLEVADSGRLPAARPGSRTRTLLTIAAISAVGAVLVAVAGDLSLLGLAVFPLLTAALTGLWMLVPVLALALLRRGGVGLLASVISGLVALPFTGFQIFIPFAAVVTGLVVEAVFAVTLYRRWPAWRFYLAALIESAILLAVEWQTFGIAHMILPMQLAMIVVLAAANVACTALALVTATRLRRAGVGVPLTLP
jgi:energy-coupling factor transport system substrate-specific component